MFFATDVLRELESHTSHMDASVKHLCVTVTNDSNR